MCVCVCVYIYIYIYIQAMKYYSNITRNKIESSVEMWINLETVIQSEVSPKTKYCILTHLCGIQKKEYSLTYLHQGFSGGSAGKESSCNAGVLGSIPGLGRSPGKGNGHPLNILAWKIPWTVQSWGHKDSDMTKLTFTFTYLQRKKQKHKYTEHTYEHKGVKRRAG